MPELTDKQRQILRFIYEFRNENNLSPTVREIEQAMGYATLSVVAWHISSLEKAGAIAKIYGLARSITLTPAGCKVLGVPEWPYSRISYLEGEVNRLRAERDKLRKMLGAG